MKRSIYSPSTRSMLLSLAAIVVLLSTAFSETVIYSFKGTPDGATPMAPLLKGKQGVLYGSTSAGGQYGCGTIFQLTPPAAKGAEWTETVLYSFAGGPNDGAGPQGTMALDKDGNLYGTTYNGGETGYGIAFELSPPVAPGGNWTETVLSNLNSKQYGNAELPLGLVLGWEGALYGSSAYSGCGTCLGEVFKLTKQASGTWTARVIYSATTEANGIGPVGGINTDKVGNIYGAMIEGGSTGCGTVFELSPPTVQGSGDWTYSNLYDFPCVNGGVPYPRGTMTFDSQGNLYGTTYQGGSDTRGTVFELTPPTSGGGTWTGTTLYAFTGAFNVNGDGAYPIGGVIFDAAGNLYGTTTRGGNRPSDGTVFKLSPPTSEGGTWSETVLYKFDTGWEGTNDGSEPNGSMIFGLYGALYGTTSQGGTAGQGTVFSIQP